MNVRLLISDRTYSKWVFKDVASNNELNVLEHLILSTINPVEHKLFTKDILTITNNNQSFENAYSSIRAKEKVAGVLILENNKTYGRTAKNRLLYKCVPDDVRLPIFLVPFDIKLGFSKVVKNKYVVIQYEDWTNKHPQGTIAETIGDVDCLESFYEYQLYCKSLHISLQKFNANTKESLQQIDNPTKNTEKHGTIFDKIIQQYGDKIEDYTAKYVFSIDPHMSTDLDDAFSIEPGAKPNTSVVTVYIAQVYFWLETLALWTSFSKRVATIYLPDKRRPMLPTILSDELCSLKDRQRRFAFAFVVTVDNQTGTIVGEPVYKNVLIQVAHNYAYEEPDLVLKDADYKSLLELSQKMDKKVEDSHDVVAHWMVLMNMHTGRFMANHGIGIFRTTTPLQSQNTSPQPNIENLTDETRRVIQYWNNNIGKYVVFSPTETLEHSMVQGAYIHITSPIRRLVDLLNQMIVLNELKLVTLSNEATCFLDACLNQIEYINTSMRSIRKIQTDCDLVARYFTDTTIATKTYKGIVFDKIAKHDGFVQYTVYLEEIKLLTRIIIQEDLPNYMYYGFRIILFEDEYKTHKKIRLQKV